VKIRKEDSEIVRKGKDLLALELAEAEELSGILIERIDRKIRQLQEIEKRLDKKISIIDRTAVNPRESGTVCTNPPEYKNEEVPKLAARGFTSAEIAALLDMPRGEVELILGIHAQLR
jgi:CRP-like cAMP-binding protein